ncbi:hypothetical protein BDW22DRAFT_1429130 [Trametopsis cervina]|nr:hypothetical protein BDW22DRAFT_1429130 [Trametopsis cervina]
MAPPLHNPAGLGLSVSDHHLDNASNDSSSSLILMPVESLFQTQPASAATPIYSYTTETIQPQVADYFDTQLLVDTLTGSNADGGEGPPMPPPSPDTSVGPPTLAFAEACALPVGVSPTTNKAFNPPYLPTIEVSSTFSLDAGLDSAAPNIVIASADRVFFFLHFDKLLAASTNRFGGLLPHGPQPTEMNLLTCIVHDRADILNIVLHCLYEISCGSYHPSLECLDEAICAQKRYGLNAQHYLARGAPLYDTVLQHAPCLPMETYALAATHGCEDLAVAASAYTLHIELQHLDSAMLQRIGIHYLQRLLRLHTTRMGALKRLLDEPLYPHIAKPYCSAEQRQIVGRAFQLAAAQVFYSATPALPRTGIETIMNSLVEAVKCHDCRQALESHIKQLVTQWILTQCTI